jgi:catechol 2,3-dioxygenase-like lactoylglutathione lyase family enzyme
MRRAARRRACQISLAVVSCFQSCDSIPIARSSCGSVPAAYRESKGTAIVGLDADSLQLLAIHTHFIDGEQQQVAVVHQERGGCQHSATCAAADHLAEPVLLEAIGEYFLAAAGALVQQHDGGAAPLHVVELGATVAVTNLHRRRSGIEQIEVVGHGAAPPLAQIEHQRIGVLQHALAKQLLERSEGIESAAGLLRENGIPIIEGPSRRRTADGVPALSIYFRDPDGNLLELMAADGSVAL